MLGTAYSGFSTGMDHSSVDADDLGGLVSRDRRDQATLSIGVVDGLPARALQEVHREDERDAPPEQLDEGDVQLGDLVAYVRDDRVCFLLRCHGQLQVKLHFGHV